MSVLVRLRTWPSGIRKSLHSLSHPIKSREQGLVLVAQLAARALPLLCPILHVSYMRLTEILTIMSGDFTGVYKTNNKLVRSWNDHRSYRMDIGDLTVRVSDVNSLKICYSPPTFTGFTPSYFFPFCPQRADSVTLRSHSTDMAIPSRLEPLIVLSYLQFLLEQYALQSTPHCQCFPGPANYLILTPSSSADRG